MDNKIQNAAMVVALIWLLLKVMNFNLSAAPLTSVEFSIVLVLLLTFLLETEIKDSLLGACISNLERRDVKNKMLKQPKL